MTGTMRGHVESGGPAVPPYTITVHEPLRFIEVVHSGVQNLETAEAARCEMGPIMAALGLTRILADISHTSLECDMLSLFSFNAAHSDLLPGGTKIAVVMAPAMRNDALFSANVASNRGTSMRLFTDRELAVAWLTEHDSAASARR